MSQWNGCFGEGTFYAWQNLIASGAFVWKLLAHQKWSDKLTTVLLDGLLLHDGGFGNWLCCHRCPTLLVFQHYMQLELIFQHKSLSILCHYPLSLFLFYQLQTLPLFPTLVSPWVNFLCEESLQNLSFHRSRFGPLALHALNGILLEECTVEDLTVLVVFLHTICWSWLWDTEDPVWVHGWSLAFFCNDNVPLFEIRVWLLSSLW